jgi:hypothetical protein
MKHKTSRSNRWFIIISVLVIISMVCGFASLLRGPQVDSTAATSSAPSSTSVPSRTPEPGITLTPTATPDS